MSTSLVFKGTAASVFASFLNYYGHEMREATLEDIAGIAKIADIVVNPDIIGETEAIIQTEPYIIPNEKQEAVLKAAMNLLK